MKRRLLVIASVSLALVSVASLGADVDVAESAVTAAGVPVLLPASALAPIHHAAGMRPPIGYLPLHAREFAAAKAAANAHAGVAGNAGAA